MYDQRMQLQIMFMQSVRNRLFSKRIVFFSVTLIVLAACLTGQAPWALASPSNASQLQTTGSTELLVYDWNKPVRVNDRGFPRNDPPRAEANGDWTTSINYVNGKMYFRAEIRKQLVRQNMKL